MYEDEADEDETEDSTTKHRKNNGNNNGNNTLLSCHREEEYKMLSQQHIKKLQLGIPVSVLGFVVIASQYLLAHPLIVNDSILENTCYKDIIQLLLLILMPIILMGILCLNTVFAVHRIGDDARIVAYIQLFFEDPKYIQYWIGWESSLRIYRSNRDRQNGEFPTYKSELLFKRFKGVIKNSIVDLPYSFTRTLNFFYNSISHPSGYDTYLFPELFISNLMFILILFIIYISIIIAKIIQYIHQYPAFSSFCFSTFAFLGLIVFIFSFLLVFHISVNTVYNKSFLSAINEEREKWTKVCEDESWKEFLRKLKNLVTQFT